MFCIRSLGCEKAQGMWLFYPSILSSPRNPAAQTGDVCAPVHLTSLLLTLKHTFLTHILVLFHVFFQPIFQQ